MHSTSLSDEARGRLLAAAAAWWHTVVVLKEELEVELALELTTVGSHAATRPASLYSDTPRTSDSDFEVM